MRTNPETPAEARRDRRLLGLLLMVCAGSAIATLPTRLVHPGWVVAFVIPSALYATLSSGWLRLLLAGLFQLAVAGSAYVWLGALRLEAAFALSLLPPLTFFTIRRQPHDTGLSLFLSFCFLLIGTMLTHGQSDWRLLVFLCAGGLAMQVEASARAGLVRHAHRSSPASRWALVTSRTQIMALMLLVGSLLYLTMGVLPQAGPASTNTRSPRERTANRRTVGLSHEFDLTSMQGSPLRIEADRVLLATSGDLQRVPTDLYLRMTYFDEADRERWSTASPHARNEFGGINGHLVAASAASVPMAGHRRRMRSLSMTLEQPMGGGELFVPPGVCRIRGIEPLEVHRHDGWFRAPRPADNQRYWLEYRRLSDLADRARLQDRQDPRLTFLPSAFRDSHELQQLTASFTRGLTPQSTALERARRIAAGLQSRCRYALREPAGHQPDTLHRFLFGNREGYCMHFATALAVMLRLQHIPCRIAVGFYGGQGVRGDPEGMRRVFGAHHAHAWVEIPLALAPVPGSSGRWRVWTPVDATPPADRNRPGWPPTSSRIASTSHPMQPEPEGACILTAVSPLLDGPLGFLDRPLDYPHTLGFLGVLAVLAILWSTIAFLRERRDQRPKPRDTKPTGDGHRAGQLLRQILRALSRYPRPCNCTLEGYLEGLRMAGAVVDVDALAHGFRAYQEIRFGSRALDAERLRTMQAALDCARAAGL